MLLAGLGCCRVQGVAASCQYSPLSLLALPPQLRNTGLASTAPSPIAAQPGAPATPLQATLRLLDLGLNPLLAWADPVEAVFAYYPAGGGGFEKLQTL